MCVTKLFPCRSVLLLEPNPGDDTARVGPKTYVRQRDASPTGMGTLGDICHIYHPQNHGHRMGNSSRCGVVCLQYPTGCCHKTYPPPVSVHCNAASHITLDSFIVFYCVFCVFCVSIIFVLILCLLV